MNSKENDIFHVVTDEEEDSNIDKARSFQRKHLKINPKSESVHPCHCLSIRLKRPKEFSFDMTFGPIFLHFYLQVF